MKKLYLILVLIIFNITPSISQCNFKTTERPDGNIIHYFNPKPMIIQANYEVGASVYKNISTGGLTLGIVVVFKNLNPQNLTDNLIIQTTGTKGLSLNLYLSKLMDLNGNKTVMGIYIVNTSDYYELKKYVIKSLFFKLNGNLKGANISKNGGIIKQEINCLQQQQH